MATERVFEQGLQQMIEDGVTEDVRLKCHSGHWRAAADWLCVWQFSCRRLIVSPACHSAARK